jgi:hypothetical protein
MATAYERYRQTRSEYLKDRSAHATQLANSMRNAAARDFMLRVAEAYQQLANRFSRPERAGTAAPHPPLTADDCRAHARRCREWALHMGDFRYHKQLQEMATEWDFLALDC